MTNKQFINENLNGTHLQFYLKTVREGFIAYSQSINNREKAANYAIEDAQVLMKVMGYTNDLN